MTEQELIKQFVQSPNKIMNVPIPTRNN